jgi:hypothetical protein
LHLLLLPNLDHYPVLLLLPVSGSLTCLVTIQRRVSTELVVTIQEPGSTYTHGTTTHDVSNELCVTIAAYVSFRVDVITEGV